MPARGKKGEPVEHNLDPTVKEMVLDIFASLLDFVPSTDDKTCYHMRSLLDYICEKHDLNIGLDSLREKAACRYRNKLNPITTEQSTQTDSQTPVAVAAPAPPTNYRDVATSTQLPPTRTYAEAASSNTHNSTANHDLSERSTPTTHNTIPNSKVTLIDAAQRELFSELNCDTEIRHSDPFPLD